MSAWIETINGPFGTTISAERRTLMSAWIETGQDVAGFVVGNVALS